MFLEHAICCGGRSCPDGRVHGLHVLRQRHTHDDGTVVVVAVLPAGDGIGEGLELVHGAVHVVDVVEVDDEGAGLGQHLPALRQVRLRRDAGGAEEALHDAVPREGVLAQAALLPPPRHLRELSPVESLHQVEVQLGQLQDGRIDGDTLVMVVVLERPHGL